MTGLIIHYYNLSCNVKIYIYLPFKDTRIFYEYCVKFLKTADILIYCTGNDISLIHGTDKAYVSQQPPSVLAIFSKNLTIVFDYDNIAFDREEYYPFVTG